MSHNTDPERAAKRHPAPILAIALALIVAALAAFWWMGSDPVEEGDIIQTESPEAPPGGADSATPGTPAPGTPATGAAPEPTAPASN